MGRTQAEADGVRRARQALLELAQGASRYLRRHASPAVRLSAALLLAASLAACNASASDSTVVEAPAVAPLQQEVTSGLPRGPGTYSVVPGSVLRDQRGVYQLEWLEPGSSTPNVAYVSRLRLARDAPLSLETFAAEDPVLRLPEGESVGLIEEAQVGSRASGTSGGSGGSPAGVASAPSPYGFWSPFTIGYLLGSSRPAYYDPPRTVVLPAPSGGAGAGAGGVPRIEGGDVSETIRPPAQRVSGVRSAVSGRAGGTGAGSAVTGRNVGSGVSQAPGAAGSGAGGASGANGATGGRPAAPAGGGVSAPRSGGFSSGSGSSGGSAAS